MSRQSTSIQKILFVCDAFWPYIGGAEITALTVLSRLARQGLEISVLTHRFNGTKSSETYENLRINRERFFSPKSVTPLIVDFFHRLLFYFKAILLISRYVQKNRPDVIVTQQLVSISAVFTSKLFQIPVVVIVHDYWPICYNRNLLLKYTGKICSNYDTSLCGVFECAKCEVRLFLHRSILTPLFATVYSFFIFTHTLSAKKVLKRANTIITVSNFIRKTLVSNGFNPRKIHVVYNPVTIENQLETQTKNFPQILYVGRLDPEKGVQFLLEAVEKICKKIRRIRLFIVGRGLQEERLRLLAKNLEIEQHVKFLNRVSEGLLSRLFESSRVVVVPSIWAEPFGRVVAEAIRCNRPVIASNVGGIPELVDTKTGILVPPGDSEALAEAIVSVITNKVSFDNKCVIRKDFSPKHAAAQYLAIFRSVVQPQL